MVMSPLGSFMMVRSRKLYNFPSRSIVQFNLYCDCRSTCYSPHTLGFPGPQSRSLGYHESDACRKGEFSYNYVGDMCV